MLAALGLDSLDELIDRRRARADPHRRAARRCRAAASEAEVLAELARAGRPQPGRHPPDRAGLPRHDHAAGHPAQRAREPGLVHGVHAVPARDQPGPARGARSTSRRWSPTSPGWRSPTRRCSTRRTAAAEAMTLARRPSKAPAGAFFVRRRHPPADDRGGAHPGRADRHRARRRRPVDRSRCRRRRVRRARAAPGVDRRGARPRRARRRPCTTRGGLVVVATDLLACACCARRASWAPTSWSARRSASACRWASAVRTPASSPCARACSARCPAGSSACRIDADGRPRLPPRAADPRAAHPPGEGDVATSAPRRCCSPSSPAMYAVYHGPEGLRPIAERRPPAGARRLASALRAGGRRASSTTPSSTRSPSRVAGRGRRSSPRRWPTGVNLRRVDDDTRRHRLRRDHHRRAPSAPCAAAFGVDARSPASTPAMRRRAPGCAAPHVGVPHPPGVPPPPLRDRDAALPAPPGRQGPRPRPLDDPARLVHDEAQRHHRDGCRSPGPSSPASTRSRRVDQAAGYRELIDDLERWLAEITGYDAVSLQPNAG